MNSAPATRLALIGAGGMIGTAARMLVDLFSTEAPIVGVLVCNLIGSFLLGMLIARVAADSLWRPFLGVGMLGGFTTYSGFAVAIVALGEANVPMAVILAVVSLLLGMCAALAGMVLGRRWRMAERGAA